MKVVYYKKSHGIPLNFQCIELVLEDVFIEGQGLDTRPQSIGNWSWQSNKKCSVPTSVVLYGEPEKSALSVLVTLDTTGLQVPAPKGTKISGVLSISHGWPQEITVEWPEKLSLTSLVVNEMKFSTKLAPLPAFAK